jgi:hypothetical protein
MNDTPGITLPGAGGSKLRAGEPGDDDPDATMEMSADEIEGALSIRRDPDEDPGEDAGEPDHGAAAAMAQTMPEPRGQTQATGGAPAGDGVRDLAESQEKYVTQKQIARGGMGAILSAVDRDIRRQVAMKVMLDDTAVGSAARP